MKINAISWWHNPYARFGVLSLGAVLLAGIAAFLIGWPLWLVAVVVVGAVNVITLAVYRYDKAIAEGQRTRVPEYILLALALAGGSPAAYAAIYKFRNRHKTQKAGFMTAYWAIVAVQVIMFCSIPIWLGWI